MDKLFVGNIPHGSSEGELQKWVESSGFAVESVEIIRDLFTRRSRRFGFVVLKNETTIKEAIAALSGKKLRGRVLKVNHATPLPTRDPDRGSWKTARET